MKYLIKVRTFIIIIKKMDSDDERTNTHDNYEQFISEGKTLNQESGILIAIFAR